MNKNTLIGALIAIVVLAGGYMLLKKPAVIVVDQNTPVPGTPIDQNPPVNNSGTPPVNTPVTAGAPIVVASSNNATWAASAVVTGQANPNGASTSYWFDYGTTTAFGNQTQAQALGSGYSPIATPAYITGLKANTLYYFRLSARNSFAAVNGTTYTFSTNNNPPPQGSIATARTLTATDVLRTTAQLNGQVNPNGASTTYWFEYGETTGFGDISPILGAGNAKTNASVTVSVANLKPLTKYFFRVNAQNQYGTVNGTTMSFTTKGPAAMSEPTVNTTAVTDIGTKTAQLNGRINPNGGETTYWFEYSSDSLLGSLIGTGTPQKVLSANNTTSNVSADITGLQTKTTYYSRLVARNPEGTVRGDIVSFKTK